MTDFDCGKYVADKIYHLLGSNPADLRPAARAQLAQLRQASSVPPGAAPKVWSITLDGIPEMPYTQRERVDWAVHVALTQFAVHQQSRTLAMHDPKQPFGRAIQALSRATVSPDKDPQESPTYRRFTAMAVTKDMTGLITHSRSIITQLRAHNIAFNYQQYARDLYWFQVPGRSADVQRRWGRDFYRLSTETNESNNTSEGNN